MTIQISLMSLVEHAEDCTVLNRLLAFKPTSPYQTFFLRHFLPIDDGVCQRKKEWCEFVAEYLEPEHFNSPTCYTVKAVDTQTGQVVGGACFDILPFEQTSGPGGSTVKWRNTSPHIFLLALVVHPNYNEDIIGQLLLQWGIDRADSLGLELWTYSDTPEAPLFIKNNIEPSMTLDLDLYETMSNLMGNKFAGPRHRRPTIWGLQRKAAQGKDVYKNAQLDVENFLSPL